MKEKQTIVFDKEFAIDFPDRAFWLRVARSDTDIHIVELPGALTLPEARKKARELGYEPTHHMTFVMGGSNMEWPYYL